MIPRKVQEYLQSFINYELHLKEVSPDTFKLDRVKKLLSLLGNPQRSFKIIHVAGSKGKGSTAAITAAILKDAGYKVGLYTSPHIYHLGERIRVLDGKGNGVALQNAQEIFPDSISSQEFNLILKETKPFLERMRETSRGCLSFFEVLTALALYHFKKEKVDAAVLEAGLGGRLDATNVVSSHVCAITPISLEHTRILGNTTEKIAREKAAIIKTKKAKVVAALQEKNGEKVIRQRCRQFHIKPLWVGRDFRWSLIKHNRRGQIFDVYKRNHQKIYSRLFLPLLGEHQLMNACTALGVIYSLRDLGFSISKEAVKKGLRNVYWPGRFEIIQNKPLIILDGAHNPASAKIVGQTMVNIFPRKKVILILGISEDKDKEGICREFKKMAEMLILTKARHPRAHDWAKDNINVIFSGNIIFKTEDVKEALSLAAARAEKEDIILVTGSLFVVSEARKILAR